MTGEGATGIDGMTSGGEKIKRGKQKGAKHELHFDILDNPDVKAESGWEEEEAEY